MDYDVSEYPASDELRNVAVADSVQLATDDAMSEAANKRRQAFRAWLARTGRNVAEVSRHSGVPQTTLYSFLSGKAASLKATTEARVAAAYTTNVDEIFGANVPAYVSVRGKVGAKAEVYPLDESSEPAYQVALPPTLETSGDYVAFEIEGFSMPPARPGWVIIFRNQTADPAEMIGYPVLVDLEDGRRLFKILRRGYETERWNLESWDGSEPIENVRLASCLPFVAMTPGRMTR